MDTFPMHSGLTSTTEDSRHDDDQWGCSVMNSNAEAVIKLQATLRSTPTPAMVRPRPIPMRVPEWLAKSAVCQSEYPAFATGILSIIGGLIGYTRKGSLPSLLGGVLSVSALNQIVLPNSC